VSSATRFVGWFCGQICRRNGTNEGSMEGSVVPLGLYILSAKNWQALVPIVWPPTIPQTTKTMFSGWW